MFSLSLLRWRCQLQPDLTNYAAYVNVTVVSPTYGVNYILFFPGLIWTFTQRSSYWLVEVWLESWPALGRCGRLSPNPCPSPTSQHPLLLSR